MQSNLKALTTHSMFGGGGVNLFDIKNLPDNPKTSMTNCKVSSTNDMQFSFPLRNNLTNLQTN